MVPGAVPAGVHTVPGGEAGVSLGAPESQGHRVVAFSTQQKLQGKQLAFLRGWDCGSKPGRASVGAGPQGGEDGDGCGEALVVQGAPLSSALPLLSILCA